MTENYIVINGKKAELTEEQLEKLGIKPEKNKYEKIFERAACKSYHHILSDGSVAVTNDIATKNDDAFFKNANYCGDEEIMKQRALHETLDRLLWRASVIAGELDNKWDEEHRHYYIYRDFDSDCIRIDYNCTWKNQDTCYFPTEDSARDALGNIVMPFLNEHPDFVW